MSNYSMENIANIISEIHETYQANDLCIDELLNSIKCENLSIKEASMVYAYIMKYYENDLVIRMNPDDNVFEAMWLELGIVG